MSLQQLQPHQPYRSEVAWLLEQIELEYAGAANGLNGLSSGSTKHEVMTLKMERVGEHVEVLKKLVGVEKAMSLAIETMNRASDITKADSSNSQAR